jgi:hypothetical protein
MNEEIVEQLQEILNNLQEIIDHRTYALTGNTK